MDGSLMGAGAGIAGSAGFLFYAARGRSSTIFAPSVYHGDRNRGIEGLQAVAKDGRSNRVDAEIMLAAIYRRERRAQDAIPLLEDLI